MDLEKLNELIEDASSTIKSNCYTERFCIYFYKNMYDLMSKQDRVALYKDHPQDDIYFLDNMFDDYMYKLQKNGSLKKIERTFKGKTNV